ncbi:hypothetical protein [Pseudomonas matsuisoli]|uniref:Uncharacterized protein n=1 Tax=Pseudomonas matsuisoli TaxID=1515666 RepID=A0A917PI46_9PSED|nr:hypothetical protein [Pseudomonas matsuisoli]GGJ79315.1 hypothetical protein GCM10009304_01490 [Pseudomonas matsuisoli]
MHGFEIVFEGELMPEADPAHVRANLARLFQVDAGRVEALFSGTRVLKTGLDEASATKYQQVLAKAGARARVRALDVEIEEVELAPPPAVEHATGRLKVVPRDEYMAAFTEVDAPDFGVAALGTDLQDERPAVPSPALDLSGLSLAPVGADLGQVKDDGLHPTPDTSHLKLVD